MMAPGRSARIYRRLLVLYPRGFRDEYGPRMVQAFGDQLRHGGLRAPLLRATLKDLVVSVSVERVEAGMRRSYAAAVGIALAVAAAAAIFMTGADGLGAIVAAAGALVVVGVVIIAAVLINRVTNRPTESGWGGWARRNWWTIPAVALAVYYLRVAITGGLVTILVSLAFAGLVVGGLWLRGRREDKVGTWLVVLGVLPGAPAFWFIPLPIAAFLALIGGIGELFSGPPAEPRIPGVQS